MTDEQAPEGSERIKISIPEHYKNETSEEVWLDLEKYIFTGFLTNSMHMAGHTFVFKTLNHHEIRNIEFMKPAKSAPLDSKVHFRHCFIATSIFMIDGENVLHERSRHIRRLIKIIAAIQPAVQDKIVSYLAALNAQSHRLFPLTEVYTHENRSRYRWLQLQHMTVHSTAATGIDGTSELGMNYAQQTWVALNHVQDQRDTVEREWANAKFIGSCFAGKGVKSIDERDRARLERERVEREDKKMEVLHAYLNRLPAGEAPIKTATLPDGRTAEVVNKFQAESVEELHQQLEAALNGERDIHDLIVEKHMEKLQKRYKTIEQNRNKLYSMPAVAQLSGNTVSGTRLLGSQAEADAYLARMQDLRIQQVQVAQKAAQQAFEENSDKGPDVEPEK